ncbi:DNA replication/repair protein RecF [Legionella shakespearei]|uniref:DNA replication and repair protein RecF n=1 Tax=Legionella shakespearei DSM 23087 TaxID=1122169 RepID=A0A0W0Z0R8_9GAMM|nr:DNA replication/repair protein RecF [Legionella shakespearei]KTD62419.1 RecF recombinational DNA repair ATPase [Legionella shakespearei DSM 23087]
MILSDLKIHHLRNIAFAQLSLHPRFNFIIGTNGSGKTSVLEAIYLLSCGHSFRSREISPIVSHDQDTLTVFARSLSQKTISIQKSSSSPTQIRLDNLPCSTTSQLAYALPCQIFYSDIFQIIDAGPSIRRSVLDWGLFHVKPEYLVLWKEYKRVLKQRNALLKTNSPYSHFIPWDKQLCELATQLDYLREEYFKCWKEEFYKVLSQLSEISCAIEYFKGWDKRNTGKDLLKILEDSFPSDKQKQYTQYGSHQADIYIESNENKAKNILSRGQQKIILIALKLAQGNLLSSNCLYLFDDLSAELDNIHLKKLLNYLMQHKGQYVITSINPINEDDYDLNKAFTLFNIHDGIVSQE